MKLSEGHSNLIIVKSLCECMPYTAYLLRVIVFNHISYDVRAGGGGGTNITTGLPGSFCNYIKEK